MHYQANILLIEDNAADSLLVATALRNGTLKPKISVAKDGEEAERYLGAVASGRAPRPDLIFLDWNLPKKSGLEILLRLKGNTSLRCVPVVVLTSSDAEGDVNAAYAAQANSFLTKPSDLDEFLSLIDGLKEYWFRKVKLPTTCTLSYWERPI